MAKHRAPREGRRSRLRRSGKQHDDLFERSFRTCTGCGEHVYVLASDCRGCGESLELRAG